MGLVDGSVGDSRCPFSQFVIGMPHVEGRGWFHLSQTGRILRVGRLSSAGVAERSERRSSKWRLRSLLSRDAEAHQTSKGLVQHQGLQAVFGILGELVRRIAATRHRDTPRRWIPLPN